MTITGIDIISGFHVNARELIDKRSGPYPTKADALSSLNTNERVLGLIVAVVDNPVYDSANRIIGGTLHYFVFNGGIADADLVEYGGVGPQGPQGAVGPQGTPGVKGPKGDAGTDGTDGSTGATGPQGPAGPTGAKGAPGIQGIQGPKGDTGLQGVSGSAGSVGPQGPKGADGSGVTIKGNDTIANILTKTGVDGDMWISTTAGVDSDNKAVAIGDGVVKAGTKWLTVGAIRGPKGDIGPNGIQGVAGPTGPTGGTGVAGPKGDPGPTGAAGAKGLKGDDGATGPQGPIGLTGAQGGKGDKGDVGNRGPKGDDGAVGAPGTDGLDGNQGPKGDKGNQGPKGDKGTTGSAGAPGPAGHDGSSVTLKGKDNTTNIYAKHGNKGDIWIVVEPGNALDGHGVISDGVAAGAAHWSDIGQMKGDSGQQGPKGADGTDGKDGSGVTIKGSDTHANILTKTGVTGDMWIVTDSGTGWNEGDGMVYTGTAWNNVGPIKGPKGDAGPKGVAGPQGIQGVIGHVGPKGDTGGTGLTGQQGVQGDSAYQVWLGQGNTGDEAAYLASLKGAKGNTGATGAAGVAGPQGHKGDTGDRGLTGPKGDDGSTGPQGHKGDKGNVGNPGPVGATGPKGPKGDTGADSTVAGPAGPRGHKGDGGAVGPAGPQGIQGLIGPIGHTGAAGTPGVKGDDGNPGPKGDPGNTGAVGPRGAKGDTGGVGPKGSKGDDGVAGPTGPAGPKGDKGEKGDTGSQGVHGVAGAVGAQGPSGSGVVIKGSDTHANILAKTGAAGDLWICTDAGTGYAIGDGIVCDGGTGAAHWTNVGPVRGPKGDTGATGATGSQGPQGLVGAKGDPGNDGAAGAAGAKGDTGSQGPIGPKGNKGDTGAPGAKGDAGIQGPIGNTGSKGATGAAGPKGDPGTNGSDGQQGPIGATGHKGDKGDPGDKGNTGSVGPAGPKGHKGDTGAPGPKGATGSTGLRGAAGAKGNPGVAGPAGPKGAKGDKGDPASGFSSDMELQTSANGTVHLYTKDGFSYTRYDGDSIHVVAPSSTPSNKAISVAANKTLKLKWKGEPVGAIKMQGTIITHIHINNLYNITSLADAFKTLTNLKSFTCEDGALDKVRDFRYTWSNTKLTSFPSTSMGSAKYIDHAWEGTQITDFPRINFNNVESASFAWTNSKLTSFHSTDFSKCSNLESAWNVASTVNWIEELTLTLKDGNLNLKNSFSGVRKIIINNPLKVDTNDYSNMFNNIFLHELVADILFPSALPEIGTGAPHLIHPNVTASKNIAAVGAYHYIHPSLDYPEGNIQLKTVSTSGMKYYKYTSNMTVKIVTVDRTNPAASALTHIYAPGTNVSVMLGVDSSHHYEHFIYFDTHEVDSPNFKFGSGDSVRYVEKILVNDLGRIISMNDFIGNSTLGSALKLLKFKDTSVTENIRYWSYAFNFSKSLVAILNINVKAYYNKHLFRNEASHAKMKCITGILDFTMVGDNTSPSSYYIYQTGMFPHLAHPTDAQLTSVSAESGLGTYTGTVRDRVLINFNRTSIGTLDY